MLAKFKSSLHGSVELYEDRIIIRKSNAASGKLFSGKKEKTIFLSQLTGITLKKGGLTSGYLHFATGGLLPQKGYWSNTDDTSSIIIGMQHNKAAAVFKARVEAQVALLHTGASQPAAILSPADELAKYKRLLDDGAITQDEYNKKKREFL